MLHTIDDFFDDVQEFLLIRHFVVIFYDDRRIAEPCIPMMMMLHTSHQGIQFNVGRHISLSLSHRPLTTTMSLVTVSLSE